MTKNEGWKAIPSEREEAAGNVSPFVPRTRRGTRAANQAATVNSVVPTTPTPAGDNDDPGPSAA
jgi:hypothetical protein